MTIVGLIFSGTGGIKFSSVLNPKRMMTSGSQGEYRTLCNILQHTASHCNMLKHTVLCCHLTFVGRVQNTLQHIATHCITLQHAATRCNVLASNIYIYIYIFFGQADRSTGEHKKACEELDSSNAQVCCSMFYCVAVGCSDSKQEAHQG